MVKALREMEMNFRFIEYFIKAHSISKHDGRYRWFGIMKADGGNSSNLWIPIEFSITLFTESFHQPMSHLALEVHSIMISLLLHKSFNGSL